MFDYVTAGLVALLFACLAALIGAQSPDRGRPLVRPVRRARGR